MRSTIRHSIASGVARLCALALIGGSAFGQAARPAATYYPAASWERRAPEQVGMDPALLAEAMTYAAAQNEKKTVAEVIAARQRQESHPEVIGPTRERGASSGLVLRHGYIVAEYGDTSRVDMTFSVTKSFLSAVAGLAFDRQLIRDLNDPISRYIRDDGFESPHNASITWAQMLQQTSEWEGWLWDKPSTIDEPRGHTRQQPGTFWNYNDVRVNRLSLALLRLFNRPLPEILKREIMDPIGASPTWEWTGYRNSSVRIRGKDVESVSGGGHWGGGMFISARDLARFGLLYLRRGKWGDRQLLSERWIELSTTPSPVKSDYGFLWWLKQPPGSRSFAARGAGGNVIWIDPDHDLLVVLRWATNHEEIFKRIVASVR
jgi:CubicO group peptidase (beta-lactamase class C family)